MLSLLISFLNTVLLVIVFYIIINLFLFYRHQYVLSKVPGPKGHFFVGHLPLILFKSPDKIFDFIRKCSKDHWPIYRFQTFYVTTINFMRPEDLEILLCGMKHLEKSKIYTFLSKWLGEGLLTSGGQKWHSRRKILTPAFHLNMLHEFLNVFYCESENFAKEIEQQIEISSEIDVFPAVTKMTLQTISETAMGLESIDQYEQHIYKKSIYRIGKILYNRLAVPWYRFPQIFYRTKLGKEEIEIVHFLHNFAFKVIKEREKMIESQNGDKETVLSSDRKCLPLLDLLLRAKNNGENIDYDGIREEVDTFMFEGHDTTASAISFILIILAVHSDIQENVYEEMNEILQNKSLAPTYNDLMEMKYMERVIKETLRLYPSVPFISRICSEEFTSYDGYRIPKGTKCHIHIFDLHRNPNIYPEPMRFDPDRFLPENCKNRHPFAYLPFSAGPRNCIGQKFAMLEIKSLLCGVLKRFKLEPCCDGNDLKFSPALVLRTKNDIRVKFVRRQSN